MQILVKPCTMCLEQNQMQDVVVQQGKTDFFRYPWAHHMTEIPLVLTMIMPVVDAVSSCYFFFSFSEMCVPLNLPVRWLLLPRWWLWSQLGRFGILYHHCSASRCCTDISAWPAARSDETWGQGDVDNCVPVKLKKTNKNRHNVRVLSVNLVWKGWASVRNHFIF